MSFYRSGIALVVAFLAVVGPVAGQEFSLTPEDVVGDKEDYSPYVDRNIADRVFFGDTHHHTSNSPDAGLVGNRLGPDKAYRFARGEEVTSSTGLRVKLLRPLDHVQEGGLRHAHGVEVGPDAELVVHVEERQRVCWRGHEPAIGVEDQLPTVVVLKPRAAPPHALLPDEVVGAQHMAPIASTS